MTVVNTMLFRCNSLLPKRFSFFQIIQSFSGCILSSCLKRNILPRLNWTSMLRLSIVRRYLSQLPLSWSCISQQKKLSSIGQYLQMFLSKFGCFPAIHSHLLLFVVFPGGRLPTFQIKKNSAHTDGGSRSQVCAC